MTRPLLLVAAGGLGREAAHAVTGNASPAVLGFLDDDPAKAGAALGGVPVLGPIEGVVDHPDAWLVICAGNGAGRRSIAAQLAALGVEEERYATILAPGVHVPDGCSVGAGSILLAGTVLTADVTIGRHVVCMPNVTLTHDDVLDDFVTLAAGVALGGGVHVGEAAYLGMNSSVRERRRVGAEAVLGMGAALVSDQPAGSVWAGVPARQLGKER